jgi:23S rRNA (adenine1618-N6)-methyltransferase
MLTGAVREGERFHFCMCNPPFFGSLDESNQNPSTACGGTPAEMVCEGGEAAFVRRMLDERFAGECNVLQECEYVKR